MTKQQLESRKQQARTARKAAQQDAQQAFRDFLTDGTDDALRRYTDATQRASAARSLAQEISDKIEEKGKADDWIPEGHEERPFNLAEHKKKQAAFEARMNELAGRFEKAAGQSAASWDDVRAWAKRQGLDVPEEPESPVGI